MVKCRLKIDFKLDLNYGSNIYAKLLQNLNTIYRLNGLEHVTNHGHKSTEFTFFDSVQPWKEKGIFLEYA